MLEPAQPSGSGSPVARHVSQAAPGLAVPPSEAESVPAPAPEGASVGAGDAPQPQDLGSGYSDGSVDTPGTQEPLESCDSQKRKGD